jgi:tRNA(fMet)-specific endonuclease VapC
MKYLLGSNVCIHVLRKRGNPLVKQRLLRQKRAEVRLCAVVVGELAYGAEQSADKVKAYNQLRPFVAQFRSLPFDPQAAYEFGRIRVAIESSGRPIGPYDLQIAAIAPVHNLTLVTHNTAEFGRVPGLVLEDWEVP